MEEIQGTDKLEDFIWEANKENKVIVLYFGADWCGPCKELKKRLLSEEATEEMPDLKTCHIDIDMDENYDIVKIYNIKPHD